MTFPVVADTSLFNVAGDGSNTNHVFNLPPNINAGQILIIEFTVEGTPTITWPSGPNDEFIEIFNAVNGSDVRFGIAYRRATGNEPATVTIVTSQSKRSSGLGYRITLAESPAIQAPEASAAATGTSTTPDPPSLTPTGGAKDYLYLATQGRKGNASNLGFPGGYPTDYANGITERGVSVVSTGTSGAERQLNAASEDPGVFTITASREWVAATLAIHPATFSDGEVEVDASIEVIQSGAVQVDASIAVEQKPGEVEVDASINAAQNGEVQVDASINAAQNGEVEVDVSINVLQNGEVEVDASIAVKFQGEVEVDASINAAQNGQVQVDVSIVVLQNGQVEVDASINAAQNGQVDADASINAAQNGIVPIILSMFVAQNGQVTVDASIAVDNDGRVQVDASINVSQTGEVEVVASIVVVQRVDGQVAADGSINASQNSQVQVAASIQAVSLAAVTASASIVVRQNAQVTVPVSINVLQGGGEVQIDASIGASQNSRVVVAASIQVAVFTILDGQVQIDASIQADFRIGLDDRSGAVQHDYIPNSGRFITRNGILFIVDNETLIRQQKPPEGFGWDLDLLTNPPGELLVDTTKPGSYPLQYKIDRDGGQFGMGVLRIEIPDDWIKT